jgi:nicotinamidase/pyrazinamidase
MQEKNKTAIIMVDLQNDFCKGGALAVPEGDDVILLANQLQHYFDLVVVTKDWHPLDHMSFAINNPGTQVGDVMDVQGMQQVLWPVHCVQDTEGAKLHPQLALQKIDHLVHKGIQKTIDSYSAFFDNQHLRSTELEDYLRQQHVNQVYVMGLATDYCVKYTCLDAIHCGFETYLIEDACRGVELQAGDIDHAIQAMCAAGVRLVTSGELASSL